MAINVVRFEYQNRVQWGVARDGRITPVQGSFETTGDFLRSAEAQALAGLQGETLNESDVAILSPVTRNQQFICQGANYRQHMIESGMNPDHKTFNMIFRKASSCIVPANTDLVRPAHVRLLDYEVELGLVLKRDITSATEVTDQNLHEYIAGITIVNDYSARDVQIPQMQFYKGKSYRSFGPVGPYLCLLSPEDFPLLRDLRLLLKVNGETRQDDNTANLVFTPAETLTELSGVQDLHAGDLLATGTPAGCALRIPGPAVVKLLQILPEKKRWTLFKKAQARRKEYLQPGDVVEASIYSSDRSINLGMQRNLVVTE